LEVRQQQEARLCTPGEGLRGREREREREKDTKSSWKVGAAVAILSLGLIMVACCVSCDAGEKIRLEKWRVFKAAALATYFGPP